MPNLSFVLPYSLLSLFLFNPNLNILSSNPNLIESYCPYFDNYMVSLFPTSILSPNSMCSVSLVALLYIAPKCIMHFQFRMILSICPEDF